MNNERLLAERLRIGTEIKALRKKRGLTLFKLAELTGLNYQNINRVELGKYSTGQDLLNTILFALDARFEIVEQNH